MKRSMKEAHRNRTTSLLSSPLRLCAFAPLREELGVKFFFNLLAFIFFLLAFPAFAQTAAEIEKLLETEAVSYERAAWLVLEAADLSGSFEGSGHDAAFNYAVKQGWLPKNAAPDDKVKLAGLSLLITRAFEIKGGIFYSLFKNPHYAYRELVYQDIIQGRSDPQMDVSGDMLLFLVSRVLARAEEK